MSMVRNSLAALAGAAALFGVSALAAPAAAQSAGVAISLGAHQAGKYDDRRYDNRRYDNRRYDNNRRHDSNRYAPARTSSKIVKRRVFDTRWRANILLVEEAFYGPRGTHLVCTVSVRGPEARRVPNGQVRSVASRGCSRRAEVRLYA
jgi:hypothetical protein